MLAHEPNPRYQANVGLTFAVNCKAGEDVIVAGSVSDEEAKRRYPQSCKAPKPYSRVAPQPQ